MKRPALFRRREIWVPTRWGWLALLVATGAIVFAAVSSLYPFLALNAPVGGRVLVVEGWMDFDEYDQAIVAVRRAGYQRIVTTGGPVDRWPDLHGFATFAERAAAYLKQHGLEHMRVDAVPAPASAHDRTYVSAVAVREWAKRSGIAVDAIDVFSPGTHARRSRLLYRLAFGGDVAIGVLSARSSRYDPQAWWRTSAGAREVVDQAIALLWTKLFFYPPAQQRTSTQIHSTFWTYSTQKRGRSLAAVPDAVRG